MTTRPSAPRALLFPRAGILCRKIWVARILILISEIHILSISCAVMGVHRILHANLGNGGGEYGNCNFYPLPVVGSGGSWEVFWLAMF